MSDVKQSILLVDDKEANLFVLNKLLAGMGVKTLTAGGGNEALHVLVNHQVDLILSDVNMPDMSGFEMAEILREDNELNNIPVVFITAEDERSDKIQQAYSLGAVDFIFKPINEVILLSKVKVFLDLKAKERALKNAVAESEFIRSFNQNVLDAVPSLIFVLAEEHQLKPVNMGARASEVAWQLQRYIEENERFQSYVESHDKDDVLVMKWEGKNEFANSYLISVREFHLREHKHTLVVLDDISEQEKARLSAQQADKAKSGFLASISHEIRTPLNGILGMTSLMAKETLTEKQSEFVSIIQNSGEHLLSLINDVLDFSKIEAGRLELEAYPFDLNNVVEKTIMMFAGKASEKSVELVYDIEPNAFIQCKSDKTRLNQVISNLLSNAIKFTSNGYVKLHISKVKKEGNLGFVRFSVADTGIGISKKAQETLFDAFVQASSATTREYGGTGLGLAISKLIVEKMGGTLKLKSDIGQGSEFYFTLPLTLAKGADVNKHEVPPTLTGKSVVVIDDLPQNIKVLKENLQSWGLKVTAFEDPTRTGDIIEATRSADVVITDHQMPGISGVELAEAVQKALSDCPPIILFTSLFEVEVKKRSLFSHITNKPFRSSVFLDLLMRTFFTDWKSSDTEPAPEPEKRLAETAPMDILVAEDNEVNRQLIKHYLQSYGYQPDFAENGQIALEKVRARHYDLILMDMLMPVMDGLEATKALKRIYHDTCPEIVAVTANATTEDKIQCEKMGMSDFVTKPIVEDELIVALQGAFERVTAKIDGQKQEPAMTQREESSTKPFPAKDTNSSQKDITADQSMLLDVKRLNSMPVLLVQSLLGVFREDTEQSLQSARLAMNKGDAGESKRIMHKIKGSALNMGFVRLGDLCAALQKKAGTGTLLSETEIEEVTKCFHATCDEMKSFLDEKLDD